MTLSDEVNSKYDNPQSYGVENSCYGKGRYPPDWDRRRAVIWRRQSDRCGRCGRLRDQVYRSNVHHLIPLAEGGGNTLENLVGLCADCHALVHPLNEKIEGTHYDAPIFPVCDAVSSVATVRSKTKQGEIPTELKQDLRTLERFSTLDENEISVNSYTFNIGSADAKRLPDELTELLQKHGIIAQSSDYFQIKVRVKLRGLKGILTDYAPEVTVQSDGEVVQCTGWKGRWRTVHRHIRLSEDTSAATLRMVDGHGKTEKSIPLDPPQTEISLSAKPPSLWG